MNEVTADFIRTEINRLGAVVIETGLFHPSGLKLHPAGDTLSLAESKALHEGNFAKLFLLEFGEDERDARRSLGVEMLLPSKVVDGDQLAEDIRSPGGDLLLAAGTAIDDSNRKFLESPSILAVPVRHRK